MKKLTEIQIIIGLGFSFVLALSFLTLAGFGLNKKIVETRQEFPVQSSMFSQIINLPYKRDYILKLKYEDKNTNTEVVRLNSNKLEQFRKSNKKRVIASRYYHIPKEVVRERNNRLIIKFYSAYPSQIDIRIRNYIWFVFWGGVILTFKDSDLNKKNTSNLFFGGTLFFLFSFVLLMGLVYVGERFFNLFAWQSIFNTTISFMPNVLLFLILGINSFLGPYLLIIQPFYLCLFLFTTTVIINLCLNFIALFLLIQSSKSFEFSQEFSGKPGSLIVKELPAWFEKSLCWLKTREFSDKCILLFMALLILCAFFLILHLESVVKQLANIAYFALVIGVIIKFIKIKKGK